MTELHRVLSHSRFVTALIGPDRPPERELSFPYGGSPDKVCLVKAASTSSHDGFREIKKPIFGPKDSSVQDIFADGVILEEPGQTAVMWTGDCLATALYESRSGRVAVLHCGRAALSPKVTWRGKDKIENIITMGYRNLTRGVSFPEVSAHLVGSICGHHFTHEDRIGKEMIKPFWNHFGDVAFSDKKRGGINLVAIVKYQLAGLGVEPENIVHDGVCTFDTPTFASYRRDRSPARNAVMVFLR